MIVEDFVMLGRTAPVDSKKYGKSVCSAGYSKELGQFIRVYPLPPNSKIKKWSLCKIPLTRSGHDNRHESWRLNNNGTIDESVVEVIGSVNKQTEFDCLGKYSTTIGTLNDQRKSLGIIRLDDYVCHYDKLSQDEERQQDIFWANLNIPNQFRPRIRFDNHDLQLLDWGCREYLRKNPNEPERLWDALLLKRRDYEHLAFVGNMNAHRTSWQIISLISRKRIAVTLDLFAA
jgi:hypothetical protein